jgi:hypothetical protein
MAFNKRVGAAALAMVSALGLGLAAAGPAAAVNRVDDATCAARAADFFSFYNEGTVCFANDGYTQIALYDVYHAYSGNNSGQYQLNASGINSYQSLGSYQWGPYYSPTVTILALNITGR